MCRLFEYLPAQIVKLNQELKDYTTFGVGGKVQAVLEPRNIKELIKCIKVCRKLKVRFQVIGNGSNLLASSKASRRVIITTRNMAMEPSLHKNILRVSAGAKLSEVILWCCERGLSGLENLFGIPATIGGIVVMNAGAFGMAVQDVLESVEVLDGSKVKIVSACNLTFAHHLSSLFNSNLIVLSASFKLARLAPSMLYAKVKEIAKQRSEKQPKGKSAGSIFKPTKQLVPAGKLIDEAGLKGCRVGGAVVSEKHANFIINDAGATDKDIKQLIGIIKKRVKECFGVNLVREVEYIGDRDEYNR